MTEIKKYCLGFMFSGDFKRVALIRKNRPTWQKGSLNGIGGKVEELESFYEAMVREFREESGYESESWTYRGLLKGIDAANKESEYALSVFTSVDDEGLEKLTSTTDEKVNVFLIEDLPYLKLIHNLEWLIPMLLDGDVKDFVVRVD